MSNFVNNKKLIKEMMIMQSGFLEINNYISQSENERLPLFKKVLTKDEIVEIVEQAVKDKNMGLLKHLTRLSVIRKYSEWCEILRDLDIYSLLID